MPEVIVYTAAGHSVGEKRGLMKDITDAVVRHFTVPAESVTVQLVESPRTDKAKGGIPFSERR